MSVFKNHILVPVDFSEQSIIALEQSYNLARLTMADITLINIIDESFNLSFFSKPEEEDGLEKKIKNELEKLASDITKKLGIRVNTIVVRGKIYEEIQKTAKELNCSFIIMGTNGSIGIKKFIGSNALRVIRESPCPVITIKGKKHRPFCKNIVLPLDLTKESREKVKKSIEISKLFGSTIHLITVLTTDDEFIVNKLKRQMIQVNEFVQEHEISTTMEFIHSDDVTQSVIDYANRINADLLMIMTQQEMNWTDIMFISSSAQQIINNSEIPVLSIRPMLRKDTTLSVFEY
jgi:nucleotide-binding universal stress UspA family protein